MSKTPKKKEPLTIEQKITRRTMLSLTTLIALDVIGIGIWKVLHKESYKDGIQKTLRKGLGVNEGIFSTTFSEGRKAKEYSKAEAAKNVRVNGHVGLDKQNEDWTLQVIRTQGEPLSISLDQLKALPKTEVIFDFKCIEGWSQVSHWGGVRFSDFVKAFDLTTGSAMNYVGLQTPDKQYYVGIDMPSAMQEQTILAYEVNGAPLPPDHGYPLRLIIPVKYGIKHLKRIGTIFFSNDKPADYWAERGYDYFSGL